MNPQVFVYDPTANDELSRVRGVGRYLQILRENFSNSWTFISDLSTIQQSNNETIFINPFFNFLQPSIVTKRIASKQIAVIHDLIPLKYPTHFPTGIIGKWNLFKNKKALNNYDYIVTDSEASKKDIVSMLQISQEKVYIIYPTLPQIFSKQETVTQSKEIPFSIPEHFCLYVGDATWNKNLVAMARAIKRANVTCICVGRVFQTAGNLDHPWQKEMKFFSEEVRGDKRFIFPGYVSDEALINLYKRARCNILLSRDEGFGFSFLEAASQGCPSVLADIPVFREIAQDAALFADPSDHKKAANQIEEYYFDENRRKTFKFRALERSKYFSTQNFKVQWGSALLP